MKAILDTNALMVPEQFGVDIFSELGRLGYIDCIVPSRVLSELRHIAVTADKGRDKRAAKVGLGLASRCRAVDVAGDTDDALIETAIREGAAVFTNDRELKKRLSSRDITVIYLRQGRYLEVSKKEF